MKHKYLKVSYQSNFCYVSPLNDLGDLIQNDILDNMEEGEVAEIKIKKVMLTKEEVEQAGEFEGFN